MFFTIFLVFVLLYSVFKCIEWTINGRDCGIPKYPGALPFINHIWILLGNTIKLWETVKKLSMTSLDNNGYLVVMFGPLKFYVLSDPDDCELLMNKSFEKPFMYSFFKPWLGEGLIIAPTAKWLRNRKLLNPMFNLQVIHGFLGVFNDQARVLVKKFEKYPPGTDFDHEKDILLVGLQTICRTALDVKEKYLRDDSEYVEAIEGILETVMQRNKKVWLYLDFLFLWSSVKRRQDQFLKIIHELAERYIQAWKLKYKIKGSNMVINKSEFSPFVHWLLKIADEYNFTDEEIKDEINTLIASGYNTSATVVMTALMYIGHYKDVQEKMYEEICSIFGDSKRDVNWDDLTRLVYMEATLKEVIRVNPIVPIIMRYTQTDIKLKQYTIPKNSNVFISIIGIHQHPSWGTDRHLFKPDRWLGPGQIPKTNLFCGFGLGRRSCIGKTYAMASMKITLVHILRQFFVSSDLSKLEMKLESLLKFSRGQHISLTPRTHAANL